MDLKSLADAKRLDLPRRSFSAVSISFFLSLFLSLFLVYSLTGTLSGRFGCAYFDSSSGTIFVYEDTQEGKHFDLTNTRTSLFLFSSTRLVFAYFPTLVLEQCSANIILTSSRSDEAFIEVLHDFGQFTAPPLLTHLPYSSSSKRTHSPAILIYIPNPSPQRIHSRKRQRQAPLPPFPIPSPSVCSRRIRVVVYVVL